MSATHQAVPLLTAADVAAILNVPEGWVRDHANGKRNPVLPSFKVGRYVRFRRDEIERWLASQNHLNGYGERCGMIAP